jgi:hypothetical protein
MARRLVRVLNRVALACPICAVPEGTQMTAGVRAGAFVLIVITVGVLAALGTFVARQWRAERQQP